MYGLGILKGMAVTLRHLFKKPFTVEYPEQQVPRASRFRGYEFVWYEDRCTGCASCAKFCPLGIIRIETSPAEDQGVGGKYKLEKFDIDTGRCMFCALCVEACPYDALFMGSKFERGSYSRAGLVVHKEDLNKGEKKPSVYYRPHLEAAGYHNEKELSAREVGRW